MLHMIGNSSLILLMILVLNFLCWRILSEGFLNRYLAISIWFAVILWYTLPGLIVLIFPVSSTISNLFYYIGRDDFYLAYALEAGALILVLGALLLYKIRKKRCTLKSDVAYGFHTTKVKLAVLSLFFLSIIVRWSYWALTYLEGTRASTYGEDALFTIWRFVYGWLFAATVFLALTESRRSNIVYISFLLIFADSILQVAWGSRIALGTVFFVYFLRAFDRSILTLKNIVRIAIFGVIAFFVLLPLAGRIAEQRGDGGLNAHDLFSLSALKFSFHASAITGFKKFDMFSAGATLLAREGMGNGGIAPYIGSALIFMPRFFWPNRPIAGSADGTIHGHPSRLVPVLLGVKSDSLNIGVSPLHIALWQLGLAGGLLYVVTVCLYILFIDHLLASSWVYSKIVGIYLLTIPTFHVFFTSPDVILKQVVLVTPIFLVMRVIMILRRGVVKW